MPNTYQFLEIIGGWTADLTTFELLLSQDNAACLVLHWTTFQFAEFDKIAK